MFDLCNVPDASHRLAELLDSNPRLCELIESVGWCCSQDWWRDSHWEQVQAALAELLPSNGNGEHGDYELVRDYVCTQVDRRQFSASLRKHGDAPESTDDF